MRTLTFFALVGIFYSFVLMPTSAGTSNQLTDVHPNYVVIGAFKYHRNAMRFTNHAYRDLKLNAKYEMNKNRNLYYVYVLNTPDREEAIAEARRLRSDSEFKDTWVYSGNLGKARTGEPYAGVDINPETSTPMDRVAETTNGAASRNTENFVASTGSPIATDNSAVTTPSEAPPSTTETTKEQPSPSASLPDDGVDGKRFFFQLTRAADNQTVEGDVDVIDLDKLRKIGTYKGNMDVKVSKPSGKSGKVSLVCEVFGYRKVQREVDFGSPEGEGIAPAENGSVMVPFELTRLQKGDIAVMYNVYFFKDAAIMRPESRYEVNSLLEMLKENPKYKIKIHGHTNGKASGRIIMLEEGNTNVFSLNNTKDGFGSAKKLSEERAAVIRKFLAENGVEESRMEVKAWGGKRPIHDKHSTRAQENVRVEIEILEN
jgi:outer membrane protein OmpA-like peptidoglycan-associated protein